MQTKKTEYACLTKKGTRDVHFVHSIDPMDVNKLLKKNVAYFYCFCLDFDFSTCDNLAWIKQWEVEVMVPNSAKYVQNVVEIAYEEDDWDDFGANGDTFTYYISFGDNFDVNSKQGNDKGVDFHVLMCKKTMFIVIKPFTCPWGQ
jgi:hypothetical protein